MSSPYYDKMRPYLLTSVAYQPFIIAGLVLYFLKDEVKKTSLCHTFAIIYLVFAVAQFIALIIYSAITFYKARQQRRISFLLTNLESQALLDDRF